MNLRQEDQQRVGRNYMVASVAGAFEILEVFSRRGGTLPLSAFVDVTRRPKGSVHRLLATLVNLGLVERDGQTGRYRLTLQLWRLGVPALSELDLLKISRPHLETLVAATDETVHLAVLSGTGDVVYISKVESARSIRVQTQIGKLNPSWCTATGRCLLAFNERAMNNALRFPLKRMTPKTVVKKDRIRSLITKVASDGYAVTKGENHPEMGGIAAPVRDYTGDVVAACGVAIPAFRMDSSLIDRCIPQVAMAARAISQSLSYRPNDIRESANGT